MLDLALGIKLHGNQKGADYYAHFYKEGYAYKKSEQILKDVALLLGSKDEKTTLNKAHNFVEVALDLHLLKDNPGLLNLYRAAIDGVNLDEIAECLAEYFRIDKKIVLEELNFYIKNVGSESVSSSESFIPKLIRVTTGREVSKEAILPILRKAKDATEDSYKNLCEEMIAEMKKDFAELI